MLLNPPRSLLVRPLEARLELGPFDALDTAAADLEVPDVAATDQGVELGVADVQLLAGLGLGEEAIGHPRRG
jgi:hypothetical protein